MDKPRNEHNFWLLLFVKIWKVLWASCLWQNEPSPNQHDHIVLGQKQYIILATRCHKNQKSVLLKRLRNCSIMRVNDESSKDMTKSLKNCSFTLINWYLKNQYTSFKHKPLHWKNTLLCNTAHQSWEAQALIYIK